MRIVFFFLLAAFSAFGQTFIAESAGVEVQSSGFYRIPVDPPMMVYAKPDLSNLRIVDADGVEVPYIWKIDLPQVSAPEFVEYKILKKEITTKCCTELILENRGLEAINNISLRIRNADVYKQARLLGSDDLETWYALKDNFYLQAVNNPAETFEVRILNFPLSNYKYFSLQMADSSSAPLNILNAGYYESHTTEEAYSKIQSPALMVSDSVAEKQTVISMRFDTLRLIDKLEIAISGPPFYRREAALYERTASKNKKGEVEWYNRFVQSVDLTSTHSATLTLPDTKYRHLILIVENNDNPALQFTAVDAYQRNRFLTAWLEKSKTYSLKAGDEKMTRPDYDLEYFKEKIPSQPPLLQLAQLLPIQPAGKLHEAVSIFANKQFIWAAIVLVGGLLIYMTTRMIRETAKKD